MAEANQEAPNLLRYLTSNSTNTSTDTNGEVEGKKNKNPGYYLMTIASDQVSAVC